MIIGICDDNIAYLTEATQVIGDFFQKKGLSNSVLTFSTDVELQSFLKSSDNSLDLLFMDIDMPNTNGITLAKEVNQKLPSCEIIYLTNHLTFATDVYDTTHLYFIIKDQLTYRLPALYEKLTKNTVSDDAPTYVPIAGLHNVHYNILASDILYVERTKRISHIHTKNLSMQTKIKLNELLALFNNSSFVRTHQSYIVSLDTISELSKTDIVLQNDIIIPISRAYQKSVKEAYLKWTTTQL